MLGSESERLVGGESFKSSSPLPLHLKLLTSLVLQTKLFKSKIYAFCQLKYHWSLSPFWDIEDYYLLLCVHCSELFVKMISSVFFIRLRWATPVRVFKIKQQGWNFRIIFNLCKRISWSFQCFSYEISRLCCVVTFMSYLIRIRSKFKQSIDLRMYTIELFWQKNLNTLQLHALSRYSDITMHYNALQCIT